MEYTLTIDDLAARLRVSRRTIDRLRVKRTLPVPGIRIGRQLRFSAAAFERYLAAPIQEGRPFGIGRRTR